jgi:hypothetical protein
MRSLPLPYRNGIRVVPCKSWPILFALCAQCGRDARDPINNPKCRHAGLEVGQPQKTRTLTKAIQSVVAVPTRSGGRPPGDCRIRIADCGLELGRSTKRHEATRNRFRVVSCGFVDRFSGICRPLRGLPTVFRVRDPSTEVLG